MSSKGDGRALDVECLYLSFPDSDPPSDTSEITEGCKRLANVCLDDGCTTSAQAMKKLVSLTPSFSTDVIFQNLFPICFNIAECERMIEKDSSSSSSASK